MFKHLFAKAFEKLRLFLPFGLKARLKIFPFSRSLYRNITRKLYFDPLRYHRYVLDQEKRLIGEFSTSCIDAGPIFHLVLSSYHVDEKTIGPCLTSLSNQQYDRWHLHLFCSSSDCLNNERLSDEERVSIVRTEKPISAIDAANLVVSECPEGYITIVGQDGLLVPNALAAFARAVKKHPMSSAFYADEDRINIKGLRHSPKFKPDWNPDLFYSYNYIGEPVIYSCAAVLNAGGFRGEYGDLVEYDMLLRLGQGADARIEHIDQILYSVQSEQKIYNDDIMPEVATRSEVCDPLLDLFKLVHGVSLSEGLVEGTRRVRWPLPDAPPLVSLIIPTRNAKELVRQCIESICDKTTYDNYEILLVDHQSDDLDALQYFAELEAHHIVRLIRYDQPFNYSAINNFAVGQAYGSFIAFVNNDIEVKSPEWLNEMVSQALREEIGCVGAKLYFPDGLIQHGGVVVGYGGGVDHAFKYQAGDSSGYMNRLKVVQNFSAVTAACLVMRKTLFEEVGGFNEKDLPVNFNDTDLCLRVLKKGYRNLWTPYAELLHHESASRGEDLTPEKRARYEREVAYIKRTWKTDSWEDPAYNSNLSLTSHDFAIRE